MNIKATAEQVVAAYLATGSVWKAAKQLGMCGQSVHERLKAIGHQLARQKWTADELEELGALAAQELTISEIARRLGRPYAGVACKLSMLNLNNRAGNRRPRKLPRGAGFTKDSTAKYAKQLTGYKGSLRQFARANSLSLELLVRALQIYEGDFWKEYARTRSGVGAAICPYCKAEFYPMTKKQETCTRTCSDARRRDLAYFDGKRRNAIGLLDGVCQLCLQKKERGLSAHHVIGKRNDPENDYLVALCTGCHHIVGLLGSRKFVDEEEGWENLISLVMCRRLADQDDPAAGVHVCVDIDRLTMEQLVDEQDNENEQ